MKYTVIWNQFFYNLTLTATRDTLSTKKCLSKTLHDLTKNHSIHNTFIIPSLYNPEVTRKFMPTANCNPIKPFSHFLSVVTKSWNVMAIPAWKKTATQIFNGMEMGRGRGSGGFPCSGDNGVAKSLEV